MDRMGGFYGGCLYEQMGVAIFDFSRKKWLFVLESAAQ
ncbi:hypothetical protein MIZ03_3254 [Rhodoferax lithotrophicus]|uniref:Uncharacterized protein n=1 Tax=Rhodoferax lithotrophicus TaxID=2798804 RepID=A0ABM7MPZ3_9BURK|nr:hypothetical protein MIZ03_3254 [Rhodoferax sp. MIZ03]